MRSRFRFALLVSLAGFVLVAAPEAGACSICLAGDPLFTNQGATSLRQGGFAFAAEVKGWEKTSGHLPGGDPDGSEINRSQRLELFGSWAPIDRLTLTLILPFAFNQITELEPGEVPESLALNGLGDATTAAGYIVWRNRDALPSAWVEARFFAKFPTGKSSQVVDGHLDPHLQLGTGSWDFGGGLAGILRGARASLYGSAFYRNNRPGSLDYTYGDALLANLAVESDVGHGFGIARLEWLTAGLEANFRYAKKDVFESQVFEDSGGSILYLTPFWRARLPIRIKGSPLVLRSSLQIPLTQSWLNGRQHEGLVWSAGLAIAF